MPRNECHNCLDKMPEDVVIELLRRLSPEDLAQMRLVSRRFDRLIRVHSAQLQRTTIDTFLLGEVPAACPSFARFSAETFFNGSQTSTSRIMVSMTQVLRENPAAQLPPMSQMPVRQRKRKSSEDICQPTAQKRRRIATTLNRRREFELSQVDEGASQSKYPAKVFQVVRDELRRHKIGHSLNFQRTSIDATLLKLFTSPAVDLRGLQSLSFELCTFNSTKSDEDPLALTRELRALFAKCPGPLDLSVEFCTNAQMLINDQVLAAIPHLNSLNVQLRVTGTTGQLHNLTDSTLRRWAVGQTQPPRHIQLGQISTCFSLPVLLECHKLLRNKLANTSKTIKNRPNQVGAPPSEDLSFGSSRNHTFSWELGTVKVGTSTELANALASESDFQTFKELDGAGANPLVRISSTLDVKQRGAEPNKTNARQINLKNINDDTFSPKTFGSTSREFPAFTFFRYH